MMASFHFSRGDLPAAGTASLWLRGHGAVARRAAFSCRGKPGTPADQAVGDAVAGSRTGMMKRNRVRSMEESASSTPAWALAICEAI